MAYISELTNEQRVFLKSYTPKDRHFTSLEECDIIKKELGLIDMSYVELIGCRNAVVQFYTKLIETPNEPEVIDQYMQSMMSVTAVIDYLEVDL